jgi:glutathione S-transferase
VQYIGDKSPASGVMPAAGTMARYRQIEWLNFVSTELHKSYSPLFNPAMPEEGKAVYRERLKGRYKYVNEQLEGKQYLMGDSFTAADAYLFTVTSWAKHVGVDVSGLANLQAYMARMSARPAVQAALKAEGLVK